jgi:hypothetical protein
MADKFFYNNAGETSEKEVITTSAGAGDAGKAIGLDGQGLLHISFMPVGVGADTVSLVTSEDLVAGDFVNIYDNGGTPTARKANAGAVGTRAHGFVLAGTTSPAAAQVYFEGNNNQLTGLTGGTNLYLSTSAGDVTATAPTGSGEIVQKLGIAVSATQANIEIGDTLTLA